MHRTVYLVAGVSIIVGHVALCVLLRHKVRTMVWWCLPMASLLSLTYALNMWQTSYRHDGVPYSGYQSDASFSISYVNNVIHGNYFGDFYDKHVPSHYPPLYFWLLGTTARLLGTDAVSIWIGAPLLVLAVLPFIVFWVGRAIGGDGVGFYACFAFFALGNAIISYIFPGREFPPMFWAIHKPYELIAALIALAWFVDVIRATETNRDTARGRYAVLVRQGIVGGLIFLLYYPWFGIAAGALLCFLFVERIRDRRPVLWKLRHLAMVCFLSLLVAAPFWVPFVSALLQSERDPNHGWHFITLGFFDVTRVTIGLGYCGALFFLGAYGIAERWRSHRIALGIGVLGTLLYCWYFSSYVTWPLLHTGFLSAKAVMFLFVTMCFGTAFALESLGRRPSLKPILANPFLLSLCSLALLPTFVQWNARTDQRLARAAGSFPAQVRELVQGVGGEKTELTALASARIAFELPAVSRIRLFLSPNIHYSNPLARFEHRARLVRGLERLESSALSARLVALGIHLLVLDKDKDGSLSLPIQTLSLHTSLFESSSLYHNEKVTFARPQFSAHDFGKILEDDQIVAFVVKTPNRPVGDQDTRERTTRAGFPATTVKGGRSAVTTLLAATTVPGPMRTPFSTTAFVPIQQWSPIQTGARPIPGRSPFKRPMAMS